jgi:transposase
MGQRHHRFGSSLQSIEQRRLALEVSKIAVAKMTAKLRRPDEEPKDKPKRRPISDHIPRMDVGLTTGDDDCAQCGGALRRPGEDVTGELEYVPGRFIVNRIVRPRFACSGCEVFTQAALPSTARQAICKANLPRGAPHRTRASGSRPSRPCIGQQIRRSPATLPPKRHLRP